MLPALELLPADVERAAAELPEQDVARADAELACLKHIGALPSQQPPDWWNIIDQRRDARGHARRYRYDAAGVADAAGASAPSATRSGG